MSFRTSIITGSAIMIMMMMMMMTSGCGGPSEPANAGAKDAKRDALSSFEVVRSVLQHPRCQNCHPSGDAPLQGDQGAVHTQNVLRGPEGKGMPGAECTTCHGPANPPDTYGAHIPPGIATGWRMPKPDAKLAFVGLSPAALCEQVKDPQRNGGKNTDALNHHLEDPLVAWGWSPGFGRAPVPVERAKFIGAWKQWSEAGAPCPTK